MSTFISRLRKLYAALRRTAAALRHHAKEQAWRKQGQACEGGMATFFPKAEKEVSPCASIGGWTLQLGEHLGELAECIWYIENIHSNFGSRYCSSM